MSVGALDSATISQLKADAANRPDQNLDEVSRRFEELFVNMLVKSMRQAVVKSDLFNSDAQDTYQQLFDQEISKEIARSGGLGLSDVIRDQLSRGASKKIYVSIMRLVTQSRFRCSLLIVRNPKGFVW